MNTFRSTAGAAALVAAALAACQPVAITQTPRDPVVAPQPTAVIGAGAEPVAAQNMRMLLRGWLGEAAADARLTSLHAAEWPDACFGAGYPNEGCARVVTPGYEMTFAVDGERYAFRTDPEAYRYRLIAAPPPAIGATMIAWTGNNGAEVDSCATAEIGTQAVAFGDCGGIMMTGRFVNATNRALLERHAGRFASFRAQTPAGAIAFTGRGAQMATPADQRAIVQLAELMYFEARSGRAGASWANAAFLRQEALGRAPTCVSVELTGQVYVSPCEADAPLQPAFLNPSELDQLYRWIDELQPFDLSTRDTEATAQLSFSGRGAREATADEKQAIRTFAADLIAELRDRQPQRNTSEPARMTAMTALPRSWRHTREDRHD
jgi:hypothetical protein